MQVRSCQMRLLCAFFRPITCSPFVVRRRLCLRWVLGSHNLARTLPRVALFEFLDPMSCGLSAFGRFFSSVRAHD
jgi:hypothetical protein